MKVTLTRNMRIQGEHQAKGTELDLDTVTAAQFVTSGWATVTDPNDKFPGQVESPADEPARLNTATAAALVTRDPKPAISKKPGGKSGKK